MTYEIASGEWAGAVLSEEFVEGVFQCYKLVFPDGGFKLIPKCPGSAELAGNADYERVKKWNAENGNPLNLE